MNKPPAPIIYGLVMAGALFFVGFATGMGGSWLPNLVFSVAMGALATVVFALVQKYFGPKNGNDNVR